MMGAAAYNRGSMLLSRLLDAEQPSRELQILRDLSDYSARHDGAVPFEPTVVRFGPADGEVSLMNRVDRGWSERSITYPNLWTLARHWRVAFLGFGRDKHSRFVIVHPIHKVAKITQ